MADASVMPTIPAANTNLITIVIAESIAQGAIHPKTGLWAASHAPP